MNLLIGCGMKIIIADDDPAVRRILTETVKELGYEPVAVVSAEDALEQTRLSRCSVLLLDWNLTGTEGLDVCREIRRRNSDYQHVCYIIIRSEGSDPKSIGRALGAGADDHVSTVTKTAELRARISVGVRTAQLEKQLKDLNNRLKFLVRTDSLTGLLNHAAILKELSMELDRGGRDNSPTTILMIDLDRFKLVNDTFGHQTGDRALISFSNLLSRNCRSFDRIGRYGGEEFLVVLPRTTGEEALSIGDRIRAGTEDLRFEGDSPNLRMTCSVGCCTSENSEKHPSAMVAAADSALFRAKEAGRNRVMSCSRV